MFGSFLRVGEELVLQESIAYLGLAPGTRPGDRPGEDAVSLHTDEGFR